MFDGTCRKRLIGGLSVAVKPTTLLHLIVEGLDLNGGETGQFDVAKSRDNVVLDHVLIVFGCARPDVRLCE